MAGGKGGSSTTTVEVPEYIEEAAKRNLTRADTISQIGYVPYYGADVAAFTPLQEAAFQNVAGQAGAFGLATPAGGVTAGMPAPQEFAGGVRGYSSAPIYEEALGELRSRRPAQIGLIESLFIDPVSGQIGSNVAAPIDYTTAFPQTPVAPVDTGDGGGGTSFVDTGGVGTTGGSDYTTYGGHRDIAHETIDQAFIDYGKQITAGTARPEDNPAYNAGVAEANKDKLITYTTDDGGSVTKPAGQLTSADFDAASNDAATQYALAGASMSAAGIKNIGGGYYQDDPTTGFIGGVQDAFGNIVETVAGMPTAVGQAVGLIDAPDSTYDPTGGGATNITYGDTSFADEILAADDISSYLPPTSSSNDNDPVPTTSSGATVIPTGATIATGAVLNSESDPIVNVNGTLMNQSQAQAMEEAQVPLEAFGGSGGDDGGGNGGGDDKSIVCTEMYRQTRLDDWAYAMKTWHVYQRKHLTPYHQVGYHTVFQPFVKGMRFSKIITSIGAYAASERTKHLRHVLTKGKSEDSLFGRVLCKVMEPPLYVVGRIVSALRKDA